MQMVPKSNFLMERWYLPVVLIRRTTASNMRLLDMDIMEKHGEL